MVSVTNDIQPNDLQILRTAPDAEGNYPPSAGNDASPYLHKNVNAAQFENSHHFDHVQGPQDIAARISERPTFVINSADDQALEYLPPHTPVRAFKMNGQWWTSAQQQVSWIKVAAADGALKLWGHQPIKVSSGVIRPPLAEGTDDTGKLYVGGGARLFNGIHTGLGRWEREQIELSWAAKWRNNVAVDEVTNGTVLHVTANTDFLWVVNDTETGNINTAGVVTQYNWSLAAQWSRRFANILGGGGRHINDVGHDSAGAIICSFGRGNTGHLFVPPFADDHSLWLVLSKLEANGDVAWVYRANEPNEAAQAAYDLEVTGDDSIAVILDVEISADTLHEQRIAVIATDGSLTWERVTKAMTAIASGANSQQALVITVDGDGNVWVALQADLAAPHKEVVKLNAANGATLASYTPDGATSGPISAIHCDRARSRLYLGGAFNCPSGSRNELRRYDLTMNLTWKIDLPFSPLWIDTDDTGEVYCGGIATWWMKQPAT